MKWRLYVVKGSGKWMSYRRERERGEGGTKREGEGGEREKRREEKKEVEEAEKEKNRMKVCMRLYKAISSIKIYRFNK